MQNKYIGEIEKLLLEAEKIALDKLGLRNIFYNEQFVALFMAERLGKDLSSSNKHDYAIG